MKTNFIIECKTTATGYKKDKLYDGDTLLSEVDSNGKLDLSPLTEFYGEKITLMVPNAEPIICSVCRDTLTGEITYT